MVIISYWLHPVDYLQMLTFGALVLFYLSIRFLNSKYYILLLGAVILSGLIQAIYGNLQLYGVYPSYHGIFKMTGSFFNPGPYAGYLAAILPVSLGFYLYKDTINISDQHPFILKWLSFYTILTDYFKRIPFYFRTFSNKGIGRNTSVEQVKKLSHALNSAINLFVLISIVAMCVVLPASRSRAAWLAVLVSAGYLFAVKYDLLLYIRSTFNTVKKKLILITSVVTILAIAGAGLYYLKKDSADGRLLIWKVSSEMIKDKPVLGHGAGKFEANYMNYQANYLKPKPDVSEARQADNVMYAYNELLKITVEHGIIGLLLALGAICCLCFVKTVFRNNNTINLSFLAAHGGFLSILIFSLFSYPSDILPIKMMFMLVSAMISSLQNPICIVEVGKKTSPVFLLKSAFASTMVLFTALIVVLIIFYPTSKCICRQYKGYKSWKDASDIYNVGAYPECLEDFELAFPFLKNNGNFLVQYGKALEIAGKFESSNLLLEEAKLHLNNVILYTCQGNNYKAIGKHTQAEQAYLHAWHMAPARFYPLYLLAKLYDETEQHEKAVTMAKKIMEKEVKVRSIAITEIQKEMKLVIEK